jgi:hypothetical protein
MSTRKERRDALVKKHGELSGKLLDQMSGPILVNEGMDRNDLSIVKAIYERIRDYIQGSVLLSFLALRRELKATQRELADMRKQQDRNEKLRSDDMEAIKDKLSNLIKAVERRPSS